MASYTLLNWTFIILLRAFGTSSVHHRAQQLIGLCLPQVIPGSVLNLKALRLTHAHISLGQGLLLVSLVG